jgi:hypothetical protein
MQTEHQYFSPVSKYTADKVYSTDTLTHSTLSVGELIQFLSTAQQLYSNWCAILGQKQSVN